MSLRWTEEEYMEYQRKRGSSNIFEPVKKPKYNNKRVLVDGILFDSQKEADYYNELKLQLMAGAIRGFCRQPEFILVEGFADRKPVTYKADFIVFHLDGTFEIIDIKGFETEIFKIKHKQFLNKFPGLKIKVVKGD
nr:MAG: hypothetical protein DIU64_11600 [Caldicoprobacter oshimai]